MPANTVVTNVAQQLSASAGTRSAAAPDAADNPGQFARVLQQHADATGSRPASAGQPPAQKPPAAARTADADPDGGEAARVQGDANAAPAAAPSDPLAALLAQLLPQLSPASNRAADAGTAAKPGDATEAAAAPGSAADAPVLALLATPPGVAQPHADADKDDDAATESDHATAAATANLAGTVAARKEALAAAPGASTPAAKPADGAGTKELSFQALLEAKDTAPSPGPALAALQAAAGSAATTHAEAGTPAASGTPAALAVDTPFGRSGWATDVGDKLTWMIGNREQRAELVLNPPQLGRIEVSLSIQGDQASVQFVSANPEVRDALQNAMPHLREVLADAGVNLGQTQVGSDASAGQSAQRRENADNSPRGSSADAPFGAVTTAGPTRWLDRGRGLVDVFA